MKTKITTNGLATIALTSVVWLCVLIAAAFALQSDTVVPRYIDAIGTILYLVLAGFFEWLKYRITHSRNNIKHS